MIRSSVVLPQPLGPSSATSSPGSMSSDTRFDRGRTGVTVDDVLEGQALGLAHRTLRM
jgi:hypothetical protein